MQFTPRTEEEIQRDRLCPAGVYPFTTLESKEQASKSKKNFGKMMFAIKQCVHADGDSHVMDYFADWFNAHKLRHYFFVTGQIERYDTGSIDANNNAFNGLQGYLKIKIVPAKEGDQYGPKNEIVDYLTQEEYEKELEKQKAESDDEIDTRPSTPVQQQAQEKKHKPEGIPLTEQDMDTPF